MSKTAILRKSDKVKISSIFFNGAHCQEHTARNADRLKILDRILPAFGFRGRLLPLQERSSASQMGSSGSMAIL